MTAPKATPGSIQWHLDKPKRDRAKAKRLRQRRARAAALKAARKPGRPANDYPCPFACGRMFPSNYRAEMHANGKHRTVHPRKAIRHGTVAGYRAEQRHGIQTCQDCRTAWAEYMRPYQARKGS